MTRLLSGLLVLIAIAHAADVTGTWSGPGTMSSNDETGEVTVLIVLTQNGTQITGTLGSKEESIEITKGTVAVESVYIEATLEGDNKIVLRLKLEGGKLVGDVKIEGPMISPVTGNLTLSRENHQPTRLP